MLKGKTVLVTRPQHQAQDFVELLEAEGATPVVLPAIQIVPPARWQEVDSALEQLTRYDWVIFTSVNGVRFFLERMDETDVPLQDLKAAKLAAIGPATAAALQEHGLEVDFVPSTYVAESIAAEIGDVAGQHILLPRADIARKALADLLREKKAQVTEVAIYRTIGNDLESERIHRQLSRKGADIVTFTSSSTVRYFHEQTQSLDDLLSKVRVACIGPITAATARELGYTVWVEAQEHTIPGLIDAMKEKLNDEVQAQKTAK